MTSDGSYERSAGDHPRAEIMIGDSRDQLLTLPSKSIDSVVTSPPYFWLRDYGHEQQIGHEATLDDYIKQIANVFDEVRRVLTDDGVTWLNLGDSYYSGNGQPTGRDPRSSSRSFSRSKFRALDQPGWNLPKKSLCGVPWRVALELQRRGWTLRADVIWHRRSAFAEPSVTDRPARQHEYIFLLSKSRRYWFDRSALGQESVWEVPHERGVREHSAAFPIALATRCIRAGCKPSGVVLDPFLGSGSTAIAALQEGKSCIGIELNPEFASAARERIQAQVGLFGQVVQKAEKSS